MAKVWNLLLSKCTLVELDEQLIIQQCLKDKSEMLHMLIQSLTEYEYIIHKDQNKFPHILPKDCIHKTLESGWGISEAKGHYSELKMSMVCFKGCLSFISNDHSDLMKTTS
jgi:hypothetical protein